MILLKPGVKLRGIQPEMAFALSIVAGIYDLLMCDCVVTSGLDSVHAAKSDRHPQSLHYEGLALDFRVPSHCNATKFDAEADRRTAASIKTALGPEYDVVLEDKPPHIHVEFDPKVPTTTVAATN